MMIFGATGPVDAHRRRPWIDWIHTSKDQASMIRNYIKWDDQPASPQAGGRSGPPGEPDHPERAARPSVYLSSMPGLQEAPLAEEILVPDVARFAPAPSPAVPRDEIVKALKAIRAAKFPLILMGAVSRQQEDWNRRYALPRRSAPQF
jgi:benzoylformate decarboxylase